MWRACSTPAPASNKFCIFTKVLHLSEVHRRSELSHLSEVHRRSELSHLSEVHRRSELSVFWPRDAAPELFGLHLLSPYSRIPALTVFYLRSRQSTTSHNIIRLLRSSQFFYRKRKMRLTTGHGTVTCLKNRGCYWTSSFGEQMS